MFAHIVVSLGCVSSKGDSNSDQQAKSNKILFPQLYASKKDDKKTLVNSDYLQTEVTVEKDPVKQELVVVVPLKTGGDVKKRYVFKDTVKVVNGEVYKCKIGYNDKNVVIYSRSIRVGTASTSQNEPDPEGIIKFFSLK